MKYGQRASRSLHGKVGTTKNRERANRSRLLQLLSQKRPKDAASSQAWPPTQPLSVALRGNRRYLSEFSHCQPNWAFLLLFFWSRTSACFLHWASSSFSSRVISLRRAAKLPCSISIFHMSSLGKGACGRDGLREREGERERTNRC